jgi:hypothetical protein
MDCPECCQLFNQSRTPRILTGCGHSLCFICIERLHKDRKISCPICKAFTICESPSMLPANLAILAMQKVKEDQCSKHSKQIEAYCNTDRSLLCVSCLLEDGHRTHDITSIEKAAGKQREILRAGILSAIQVENSLIKNQEDIDTLREITENSYHGTVHEFKELFALMRKAIDDREAELMKRMAEALDLELESLREKEAEGKRQLEEVQKYKEEVSVADADSDLDVLKKIGVREIMTKTACSKVSGVVHTKPFSQFTKDVESNYLAKVIKDIFMSKTKPTRNPQPKPQDPVVPLALANAAFSRELRANSLKAQEPPEKPVRDERPRTNTIKAAVISKTKRRAPAFQTISLTTEKGRLSVENETVDKDWGEISSIFHDDDNYSMKSIDLASLCRPYASSIYVMGGFGDKGLLSIEKYDANEDSWQKASDLLSFRTSFALASQGDKVLLLGGKINGKRTETVEEFNRSTNRAKFSLINLTSKRSGLGALSISNDIYAIGGNDGKPVRNVEQWNGEQWLNLPSMKCRRDELSVALGPELNIYAIGGHGGSDM